MTPYLTAYQEYSKHDRGVPWVDALDFHFQHGVVIATPIAFLMARPVWAGWSDGAHLSFDCVATTRANCWHIWAAAGALYSLFEAGRLHRRQWISFQRHGQERVRRVELRKLFDRMMDRRHPEL